MYKTIVTFLVRYIIVGVLLFLSHYYLDPVYQQLNATTALNVVDVSVSFFSIGIAYSLILYSGIIIHCVNKNQLCHCAAITLIGLSITLLFLPSLFILVLVNFYDPLSIVTLFLNNFFNLTLVSLIYIITHSNYTGRFTCFTIILLLCNIISFLFLLLSLGFFPQPPDDAQNWENTINQSYGSAISLIFTALHVALINFVGFISSVIVIKKYLASNENTSAGYRHLDTAAARGSDYGLESTVISYYNFSCVAIIIMIVLLHAISIPLQIYQILIMAVLHRL